MLVVSSSVGNLTLPMIIGVVMLFTFQLDVLNDRTDRPIPAAMSHGNSIECFQWFKSAFSTTE
jgi:hypothetical protein